MTPIDAESTLTDRYQTTIPEPVRRALNLGKRDKLHYAVQPGGEVILSKAAREDDEDPVMLAFLDLIARDIEAHPERLQAFDPAMLERIQQLVKDVDVGDINAPLPEDDDE
jgi:antitoxin PrlF